MTVWHSVVDEAIRSERPLWVPFGMSGVWPASVMEEYRRMSAALRNPISRATWEEWLRANQPLLYAPWNKP